MPDTRSVRGLAPKERRGYANDMYRESATRSSTRWEFRTLVSPDPTLDQQTEQLLTSALNKLGAEGWEVVSTSTGTRTSLLFLLKRQLP